MNRSLSFPMVDVLRGFAALSVLVYHVIEHFQWSTFPIAGPLLWFRIGWMGVDLFLVISGFVIALSAFGLIDRLGAQTFRMPFAKRRIARIAPLHYLTCLVFIAFSVPALALQVGFSGNLLSHVAFFHNMNWRWSGAINGPNWSVGLEMQFYLLILLLAPVLRTCRWWLIPLCAIPLAWGWRYGAFVMVPIDPDVGPFLRFWASTQLPGTLDQFAAGVLLARLMRSGRAEPLLESLRQRPWLIALVAASAIWLALALFWPRASYWDHAGMVVFWRSLAAAAFGLVVLATCVITHATIVTVAAPLRYLGTISYGIYLWHLPVLLSVKQIKDLPQADALALVMVLTLLLASGSWHFFEKRFVAK